METLEITWRQWIELGMLAVILIWFAAWTVFQRKSIMDAIKGPDKRLDLVDLVTTLWLVLFPVLVLTNVFLDLHVEREVWISMDAIMLFLLGKKGYEKSKELANKSKEN